MGCSSSASESTTNSTPSESIPSATQSVLLPAGWEQAAAIPIARESAMIPDSGTYAVRLVLEAAVKSIRLREENLWLRCNQELRAFLRASGNNLDVLIQPVDMHPTAVGKCATPYDLSQTIPAAPGTFHVRVYFHADYWAGEPRITLVGEGNVTVEP